MFTYSYMFLSNSVEFSVILQCTMTQYHICCVFSRLSCEFRPWEPEPEKDLLPHKLLLPRWFALLLGYWIRPWQMRPHQERTEQCKIIVRPLEPSSSLFCVMQGAVSSQHLSHLFVPLISACTHTQNSFYQHLPIQPYIWFLVRRGLYSTF